MRIVSLISSGTEIVCALGLRDSLVGVSHECDHPDSIRALPVLSEPLINPKDTSGQIDRQIREIVRDGLSIYLIKDNELERLNPDLVVTQDQCEVCAVSLKDVEKAVRSLTLKDTKVCSLRPHILEDIRKDFLRVGEATGKTREANELLEAFDQGLYLISQKVAPRKRNPRVLFIEWLDPLIIAGGWMPELIRIAGGDPQIVSTPERFRMVKWDEAISCDPEMVFVAPCGYGRKQVTDELKTGKVKRELNKLIKGGSKVCYVLDGNSYFNRPGPRILDSTEILACLIHPDLANDYRARHSGSYERWPGVRATS